MLFHRFGGKIPQICAHDFDKLADLVAVVVIGQRQFDLCGSK